MSWMDTWSRPSKRAAVPAPLYLLPTGPGTGDNARYCRYCGRVISERKSRATSATQTPAKYCSSRCRHHRFDGVDRGIEDAFVLFLTGGGAEALARVSSGEAENPRHRETEKEKEKGVRMRRKGKGDGRVLVPCGVVEEFVFGCRKDPEKDWGRRKNKARRGVKEEGEWRSVDMVDHDVVERTGSSDGSANGDEVVDGDRLASLAVRSGTRVRPGQDVSEVNGSVGGEKGRKEKIEETEEMAQKRRDGEKKAEERERVRCAARRGVVFGFVLDRDAADPETRKCEAIMQGQVVEPSFAKGEWAVRWREE
ncbi:hypothetical protein BU24DRAFT_412318 [Aaosphaeria arxii CBS 175.79]|uniref:Uncharacterized protein n=1 Tax=Aaosphaeria arxii CBS 175.79 TaxID=1450172 RepID=A0A6A5XIR3_9PLEO|nr:uncharacterized protein BU24DRAFT_412318 [Aaosphaeria arxii CBS 175.79]KAF2013012.1 hypothetical protein BU24DRAFT_412318 [Aaosphaeria arxii CBS 175.79]